MADITYLILPTAVSVLGFASASGIQDGRPVVKALILAGLFAYLVYFGFVLFGELRVHVPLSMSVSLIWFFLLTALIGGWMYLLIVRARAR